ncbi:MAG: hypothetical protein KDB00_11765 [Planctomycetales bacterium]|nr:hypothetical protein [Planctomycetales bacterium]
MTQDSDWLEQLSGATDYRQLQSIFQRLADSVAQTTDPAGLVTSIDEAISRIARERTRDDEELRDFESQYEHFKQQQRGVLGWFRRHVPFTETRRQEVQHKEAISDQRAEILADNLVIARAQMLKQKLLPPQQRQLGESTDHWKEEFARCASVERIGEFAGLLESLATENDVSAKFVAEIRAEIDAFAAADFSSKEDRQSKKRDLQSAREELAELDTELQQESSLRDAMIKRAGELVRDELLQNDFEFYDLHQRMIDLRDSKRLAKSTAEKTQAFAELVDEIRRIKDESESCLRKREELTTKHDSLERELQDHRDRLARIGRKLADSAGPYDDAKRNVDRAEAAYLAAKRIFDQQQQSGDPGSSGEHIKVEFARLEQDHKQALAHFDAIKVPHESVETKFQRRKKECDDAESSLQEVRVSAEKNESHYQDLAANLQRSSGMLPKLLSEFQVQLDAFLKSIETISFRSNIESFSNQSLSDDPWSWAGGRTRNDESADMAGRMQAITDAIAKDQKELKSMAFQARQETEQRWADRCQRLLGASLAEQVSFPNAE